MTTARTVTVAAKGDRELVIMRAFDAPRRLVYEALTKPELVKRWLLGPPGWSMPVCEIDLRVGGQYRYVWLRDSGKTMGMGGIFREIIPNERLVQTESFDDPWYPGEALNTTTLAEQSSRTTMTLTVQYESKEARDGVLASNMETGVEASYSRLADMLAESVAASR